MFGWRALRKMRAPQTSSSKSLKICSRHRRTLALLYIFFSFSLSLMLPRSFHKSYVQKLRSSWSSLSKYTKNKNVHRLECAMSTQDNDSKCLRALSAAVAVRVDCSCNDLCLIRIWGARFKVVKRSSGINLVGGMCLSLEVRRLDWGWFEQRKYTRSAWGLFFSSKTIVRVCFWSESRWPEEVDRIK